MMVRFEAHVEEGCRNKKEGSWTQKKEGWGVGRAEVGYTGRKGGWKNRKKKLSLKKGKAWGLEE